MKTATLFLSIVLSVTAFANDRDSDKLSIYCKDTKTNEEIFETGYYVKMEDGKILIYTKNEETSELLLVRTVKGNCSIEQITRSVLF